MPQPTQDKRGILLPNDGTPVYDWRYPDGTRAPAGLMSLSGAYTDGVPVTVTTSLLSFGTKAQSVPLIWDNFKSGVNDQLLDAYDPTWVAYASHDGAMIKSTNARYSGSKHAWNDSSRHEFDTNYKTTTATRKRFLSYWYRTVDVDVSSTDQGIIKHCRLTTSSGAGGGGVYNGKGVHALSSAQPQSDSAPYVFFTDSGNTIRDQIKAGGGVQYLEVPWNEWVRIDMWLSMSDVNVANGIFGAHVHNGTFWERTDIMQNVAGQTELLSDSMILGLMQANAVGSYAQQITDVYLDSSFKRFEIGNAPAYEDCTQLEVQPYSDWGDLEVELVPNIAAISGPKYLFYVDESHGASDSIYVGG